LAFIIKGPSIQENELSEPTQQPDDGTYFPVKEQGTIITGERTGSNYLPVGIIGMLGQPYENLRLNFDFRQFQFLCFTDASSLELVAGKNRQRETRKNINKMK